MEKLLHERLREHTGRGVAFKGKGYHMALFDYEARNLADEIERYYIPREEHESKIKSIIEAQHESAHHIIKTWAAEHGMPMKDKGETITQWLDRWTVMRPRFENGEPVPWCGEVEWADFCTRKMTGFGSTPDGCLYVSCYGDGLGMNDIMFPVDGILKRPCKVLDADGVEIKRGDEVWRIFSKLAAESGSLIVEGICDKGVYTDLRVDGKAIFFDPSQLTHDKPVFDADDVRICKGDTVWFVDSEYTRAMTVDGIEPYDGEMCVVIKSLHYEPKKLTHRELDSISKVQQFASQWAHPDNIDNSSAGDFRDAMQEVSDRLTDLIERGA